MNEDNRTWLLDSVEEGGVEEEGKREEKREGKGEEKREEKEKTIDEYDELRKILRTIRPKDERINAIVNMMGYVSLDNLEALRDNLRLAGWRVNDITLAIKLWGYRRGIVGSDADIDDLIISGLERETKAKGETKIEEELEKEEKEFDKTVDRLYLQQIRAKARDERLKALGIGAEATKKEEKEVEEEKITYVIEGTPVKL
ncbi:MAG: hypothetical protein QMD22_10505, partial [archaeon]|nr:hypothetical protein [archaeon]